MAPQNNNDNNITYFAETDYRNTKKKFGIKAIDRTRHMYVIGKTGMGKSTLLENMAIQDIQNGHGVGFIDPHGGTAEKLLDYVPKERVKDVVYFAPFDTDYPVAFNIMEDVGYDKRHLVVSGLMGVFKKIWQDAWSARMEYILSNTLFALLEYPDSTLLGVNRMYVDKEYRKKVVENITDPSVKSFWVDEFAKYSDRYTQDATPAIQNKIGQFTNNPLVRDIVGQPHSAFDIRKLMDEKKILIMNLSKGRVGDQNATLIGSMLVTKIYLAAMSRADAPEAEMARLPNFYFFVDEFQSFANESFADILSEARKYKLNLTIAHQYVEQMPEEVRAAVFGNVGTMVTFRIGAFDAEIFEREFAPKFEKDDMVSLGIYQIYLKLMIDGVSSAPFSGTTIPPIELPEVSYKDEVIQYTREHYAKPRAEVEEKIIAWHAPAKKEEPEKKSAPFDAEKSRMERSRREKTEKTYVKPTSGASENFVSARVGAAFPRTPRKPAFSSEEARPEQMMPPASREVPSPSASRQVPSPSASRQVPSPSASRQVPSPSRRRPPDAFLDSQKTTPQPGRASGGNRSVSHQRTEIPLRKDRPAPISLTTLSGRGAGNQKEKEDTKSATEAHLGELRKTLASVMQSHTNAPEKAPTRPAPVPAKTPDVSPSPETAEKEAPSEPKKEATKKTEPSQAPVKEVPENVLKKVLGE